MSYLDDPVTAADILAMEHPVRPRGPHASRCPLDACQGARPVNLATILDAARAYYIPAPTLWRWRAAGLLTRHGDRIDLDELDALHDRREAEGHAARGKRRATSRPRA